MDIFRRSMATMTVAPEGRKLLRIEAKNAATPIENKPEWIRTKAVMGPEYRDIKGLVKGGGLHTVCEEAGCPNIFECWEDREATFLIGGEQCTRRCDFCQIDTGKPAELDRDEPRRVAESVQAMGLRYSTITGVARDDQPDGAAALYAETIRVARALFLAFVAVVLAVPPVRAAVGRLAWLAFGISALLAMPWDTIKSAWDLRPSALDGKLSVGGHDRLPTRLEPDEPRSARRGGRREPW